MTFCLQKRFIYEIIIFYGDCITKLQGPNGKRDHLKYLPCVVVNALLSSRSFLSLLVIKKKAILLLSEPSPRGFRAPDGGDHGKDQEADDHGFHSRHGPASPSSSPLPVLCLGMLWRTELAGCAQRDSAEPVK